MQTTNKSADVAQFKIHLKETLAANPKPITFEIRFANPQIRTEIHESRFKFGTRLLALFEDIRFQSLALFAIVVKGEILITDTIIDESGKIFTDVEKIIFEVETIGSIAARYVRNLKTSGNGK